MFKRLGKYGAFLKPSNIDNVVSDTQSILSKSSFFSFSLLLTSEHGKRETSLLFQHFYWSETRFTWNHRREEN